MTVLFTKYNQLIKNNEIVNDPLQRELLSSFQCCYDQLMSPPSFWRSFFTKPKTIQGIYIFGGVGIGKTFMMDLFFNALPIDKKLRAHFHDFMKNVQDGLRAHQGTKNPLESVANDIAQTTRVLCFDEFFVSDIADAMILERLFLSLFSKGIVLIATSNIAPHNLYLKGLHRKRFLPAIRLIESHCHVIDMHSKQDYRFKEQIQNQVFFLTSNRLSNQLIKASFNQLCHEEAIDKDKTIVIESRSIKTKYVSNKVVWFDFAVICNTPRSQVDYLQIASRYTHVFIDNVPVMSDKDKASITYFIYLVDVFYDKKIKLFLSMEACTDKLYIQGDKIFEYQRTKSRLHEMQNRNWFN